MQSHVPRAQGSEELVSVAREVSEREQHGIRPEMHRASKGTLGTCDSGLAGIMVAMERGRWVKAHNGGTVTDRNKSELWSQQNEGQTAAA